MATLEDKILGEKLHNYCSSSDESEGSDSEGSQERQPQAKESEGSSASLPEASKWEGTSSNTGPKGVIKDWQRYKQLEIEKRAEDEREKIELMKKLTLSVQTALDEEREKARMEDPEFADLLNDQFLLAYQKQRMNEMLQQANHNVKFGKLITLPDTQSFLDAIDKENKAVLVIVHIYEDNVEACHTMNQCLKDLAELYANVKFCSIVGSLAGMSVRFKTLGVPALLIYRSGQLVGNFVRLTDDLGTDFQPEDVQAFLVEHGMLEDKSCKPAIVKQGTGDSSQDDDSN